MNLKNFLITEDLIIKVCKDKRGKVRDIQWTAIFDFGSGGRRGQRA
jgi:hypothetical protein